MNPIFLQLEFQFLFLPPPNPCFKTLISFSVHLDVYSITMKLSRTSLITKPSGQFLIKTATLAPNVKWINDLTRPGSRFTVPMATSSTYNTPPPPVQASPPPVTSDIGSGEYHRLAVNMEEKIEKVIYGCRFLAILAVWGSLVGSFLCFIKGCVYVATSYQEYLVNQGKMIFMLVEAIDVYLLGTVMLVFGMGLYELFISNLDIAKSVKEEKVPRASNLFGLFTLKERPQWLEIKSVNQLKTKLGHVIVMLLLIGLLDKSKKAAIVSSLDLLCFSASIFVSSACLYLLSMLKGSH